LDGCTYAIVAVIELARYNRKNPKVPKWLDDGKDAEHCSLQSAGARTHAKFLINYSSEELLEMERLASKVEP
jgi:hypothetical protein